MVVDAEVVPTETEYKATFRTPPDVRVEVLAMHFMGHSYESIVNRTGVARATIHRIIYYAPEKEGLMRAMQTAAQIELQRVIPAAVKAVAQTIEAGDSQLGFAILLKMGIINDGVLEIAKNLDDEFFGWTPQELKDYVDGVIDKDRKPVK